MSPERPDRWDVLLADTCPSGRGGSKQSRQRYLLPARGNGDFTAAQQGSWKLLQAAEPDCTSRPGATGPETAGLDGHEA